MSAANFLERAIVTRTPRATRRNGLGSSGRGDNAVAKETRKRSILVTTFLLDLGLGWG